MGTEPDVARTATVDGGADAVDVLLADGGIARLRPFRSTDAAAVRSLHDEAPESSIVSRFFSPSRVAAQRYIDHLCESSPEEVTALLAEVDHEVVALATAERIRRDLAEVSFFVSESAKGHGVATLLLEHLAARARETGVRRFVAEVMLDNRAMQGVLTDAGFDAVRQFDSGVVHLELDTAATERAIRAADRRECAAEARSLAPLFSPSVVAVTGVHGAGADVGRSILASLVEGGFGGELVAVHPEADAVLGVRAYPTIAGVPDRVDLLVCCVAPHELATVVEEAARARVRCTVLVSSGSAGTDSLGPDERRRLVLLARENGMRLVGPDSLGICSFDPTVRLHATFAAGLPGQGGLAVASQSGGVGLALMDAARRSGVGLSSFVSLGGKYDVSGNDLLAAWMEDERVRVAALYLESFGNPRKFARLAKRFSEHKPLLTVVGALSAGQANQDHGGSSAGPATPQTAVEAIFTQAGVIATRSLDELVDTAKLLDRGRRPRGRRLGIVTNAGGLGRLAARAARLYGLEVPEPSSALAQHLAGIGPAAAANPVDLGAASTGKAFGSALRSMLEGDEVDSALVVFTVTRVGDATDAVAAVRAAGAASEIPVLLVVHGETVSDGEHDLDPSTAFASVESAIRALANVVGYCDWLGATAGDTPEGAVDASEHARQITRTVLAQRPIGTWVDAGTAIALLGGYGVRAPGQVAVGPDGAVEAADRVGYPVVVKVADPRERHKRDRGLVATDLASGEQVHAAVTRFAQILDQTAPAVLVQPALGGLELAVATRRDATYGPVVSMAAAGLPPGLRDQRVFLVPPVTDADTSRARQALRLDRLREGRRDGDGVGDLDAFERVVLAASRLAEDVPEIAEMELDPVLVHAEGASCVDVRIRVAPEVSPGDAGVPRRLRPPS
jgi:acyl-CoA synthetase (NDP forming)/RimJ/RimL family protein N-acetyltransferase